MPPPTVGVARAWRIAGRVQGVGFRPFVYRLAHRHGLAGWVRNGAGQVEVLAQGSSAALAAFEHALIHEAPAIARPEIVAHSEAEVQALAAFRILPSTADDAADIHLPPDYFICDDCLAELNDPRDRRHRYPFINCTQCGPRYTLITRLPYDRPHTTMAGFSLCPACRAEYENPLSRRFHAEPIACPECGPTLAFHRDGKIISGNEAALAACVTALRQGLIIAAKGVGGYHLLCDASDAQAVARLRTRKYRPHKPLAVMYPPDLALLKGDLCVAAEEEVQLRDSSRPIVLLRKQSDCALADNIAPGLDEVGAMLAYSPLHHLLLQDFGKPLVATSANVSGEPVLTDAEEVEARLAQVADTFLHHDRAIARPADDSVVRVIAGSARMLRLGRGSVPLECALPQPLAQPVLAVGGHMKNTIALGWGNRAVVSPHIGDLDSPRSLVVFEQVIADLCALYQVAPQQVACDAHPGYASSKWATKWADKNGARVLRIFHHHAHASALAGEYPEVPRWLVYTWDGVGYGVDGTLWGGEALLGRPGAWQRVATMRPFHLPGGERAGREPWRSAAALCWEAEWCWHERVDEPLGDELLHEAWQRRINAPATSAVGRLFDAAASQLGLAQHVSFEGQGPMWLEAASAELDEHVDLPLRLRDDGLLECDWAPLLPMLADEARSVAERGGVFHASLARAALQQALHLRAQHGDFVVGLSGGVFQNRLLTEALMSLLHAHGFEVRLARHLPYNDGGLSYGQLVEMVAMERVAKGTAQT
ncbi:MAG: carbamoyltransferase HypF [Pseudomonadota bacterium]